MNVTVMILHAKKIVHFIRIIIFITLVKVFVMIMMKNVYQKSIVVKSLQYLYIYCEIAAKMILYLLTVAEY